MPVPPCDAPPEAGAAGPPVPVAAAPPWSSRTWARTAPGPPASAWVSAGERGGGHGSHSGERAAGLGPGSTARAAGPAGRRRGGAGRPLGTGAGGPGRAPLLPLAEGSLVLLAARGHPARAGLAGGAGRSGFPPVPLSGYAALARGSGAGPGQAPPLPVLQAGQAAPGGAAGARPHPGYPGGRTPWRL